MSGWIKLEKDLREDGRFTRMVDALIAREAIAVTSVTQARYISNGAVTRLLGCLAQLWMYADSHIREDDTLDIGADKVDELVGLQGFTELMPTDWLEVIDAHSVKLPSFQHHNGTEAKKKALTNKRVANHRIRTIVSDVAQEKRTSVTGALPDQTRPDQTKEEKGASAVLGLNLEAWEKWRAYRTSIGKTLKPASLLEAAKKMAKLGALQADSVDHCIANGYQGLFPVTNTQRSAPIGRPSNVPDEREIAELQHRAQKIGFRDQNSGESIQAYQTLLSRAETEARNRGGNGPVRLAVAQ